ncbi:MAG: serine hydrolase domain-containing protein [Sandaracinaceae bacterium]
MNASLTQYSPSPARGTFADGFEPVARTFAQHLRRGEESGAGFVVYHRGQKVVDLYGGVSDAAGTPWEPDTRSVVFSSTKGLAAIALLLLHDRGQLEWDAPVATYWPGFAAAGKERMTVATLLNHRGGLPFLSTPLDLDDCLDPSRRHLVTRALEQQAPAWKPDTDQGYHAITWGMYVTELFERVAGERMGAFLEREVFGPLGSDARLGTPPEFDARFATLIPPSTPSRVRRMLTAAIIAPESAEGRVARASIAPASIPRRAFLNPRIGKGDIRVYNDEPVRRAELPWGSATATADGLARAYLPFANGGEHDGRRYVREASLTPIYARLGWSERDRVLQKPVGWSHGFLKEERHMFSPNPASFGHAGMGGYLGWCDPIDGLAFGYVMNRMDWRVRSPRCIALCRAIYDSAPVRDAQRRAS